jgi:hypothetical protein
MPACFIGRGCTSCTTRCRLGSTTANCDLH